MKANFYKNVETLLSDALKAVEDNHNLDVITCKDLIMRALGEVEVQKYEEKVEDEEVAKDLMGEEEFLRQQEEYE